MSHRFDPLVLLTAEFSLYAITSLLPFKIAPDFTDPAMIALSLIGSIGYLGAVMLMSGIQMNGLSVKERIGGILEINLIMCCISIAMFFIILIKTAASPFSIVLNIGAIALLMVMLDHFRSIKNEYDQTPPV
jgi:hypothetical protein